MCQKTFQNATKNVKNDSLLISVIHKGDFRPFIVQLYESSKLDFKMQCSCPPEPDRLHTSLNESMDHGLTIHHVQQIVVGVNKGMLPVKYLSYKSSYGNQTLWNGATAPRLRIASRPPFVAEFTGFKTIYLRAIEY